jgi:hypothetical protein
VSKKSRPQASDPYAQNNPYAPPVWGWETVDPLYQDVGANDEGYSYRWCMLCVRRTEHGLGDCIACETA